LSRVLLDTNVLLLFLVGNRAPERLSWKRVAAFDATDVVRLNREIGRRKHVSLPNVLTETSNLLGSGTQEAVPGALRWFAEYCHDLVEIYVPSSGVVADEAFLRLGLTDTAISRMAERDIKVVTIDHALSGRLKAQGLPVVNLLHQKTPPWPRR
jgi:hypothetical protein